MARIKLKACDTCGAVTKKVDEEFHPNWHAKLEGADVERQRNSRDDGWVRRWVGPWMAEDE